MQEALNGQQIALLLKKIPATKKIFISVCARDLDTRPVRKIEKKPRAIIHNTGYLVNGIHWVLLLCTKDCTVFIDTFGRSPSDLLIESTARRGGGIPILYNTQTVQHSTTQVCGHWTIYYLIHFCKGYTLTEINSKFSKNLKKNDLIVFNFVKKLGRKWGVTIR